jgi:hypothetical protein
VLSGTETIYEGLPYLLLAKALGTIQQQTSPTTGKSELVLLTKDADGFDNPPVKLGFTLVESMDKIDAENIDVIRRTVQKALDQDFIHIEKQAELRKRVVGEVEEIKAERKGDIDDPVYKRFLEAGKRAVKLVAREG